MVNLLHSMYFTAKGYDLSLHFKIRWGKGSCMLLAEFCKFPSVTLAPLGVYGAE